MIVARFQGKLSRAVAGSRAECPECRNGVYARLPENAIRHWARLPLAEGETRDCSNDAGEMTEWHLTWQYERTDPECIEVFRDGFRADAINAGGFVIEFQHSSISPEAIASREAHWGRGLWVLDGTDDVDGERRVRTQRRPDQAADDPWCSYRWPRSPKLLFRAKWPCWIDLGGDRGLLQVWGAFESGGNGWVVTREWFIDNVLNGTRSVVRRHDPQRTTDRLTKQRRPGVASVETEEDLKSLVRPCLREPKNNLTLDWSAGSHWGDDKMRPCIHCNRTALLVDDLGRPSHKGCAEAAAANNRELEAAA